MTDYAGAISYFVDESRVFIGQNDPQTIVIHGTGGSPDQTVQGLGDYFRTTDLKTSVHYGVDRAGNVAQYVYERDGAGGNCCEENGYDPFWQPYIIHYGNLNLCSISIEHVNDLENSLPLTDAQKTSSFKLIAYLSQKYSIPFDHIKPHSSIAPFTRARCPGPAYPWNELEAFLGGKRVGVPQNWTDDGTTLTAPNGIPVVRGFRDYILSHPWDSQNYPLEEEHTQSPLEVSNPGLGNGTQQVFRWSCLEWTPTQGVFLAWIGQELLALRRRHG